MYLSTSLPLHPHKPVHFPEFEVLLPTGISYSPLPMPSYSASNSSVFHVWNAHTAQHGLARLCFQNPQFLRSWWKSTFHVKSLLIPAKDFSLLWAPMVLNLNLSFSPFCIARCCYSSLFSHLVMSDSLWLHGPWHARLPCPPLPPRICSNSCSLSQCCYLTISSAAACIPAFLLPFKHKFLMSLCLWNIPTSLYI